MTKIEQLQKIYQFTPEDLAQNKNGIVTENQRKELLRRKLIWPFRNVIAVCVLIFFISLCVAVQAGFFFLKYVQYYYFVGGAIGVIAAGSFIPLFFEKQDLKLKTAHGQAKIVDRIKDQKALSENGASYYIGGEPYRSSLVTEMFVEGVAFGINGIVEHGDICRIYYVGDGDIVSIEVFD
jgi:hypothetical protein